MGSSPSPGINMSKILIILSRDYLEVKGDKDVKIKIVKKLPTDEVTLDGVRYDLAEEYLRGHLNRSWQEVYDGPAIAGDTISPRTVEQETVRLLDEAVLNCLDNIIDPPVEVNRWGPQLKLTRVPKPRENKDEDTV